MSYTNPALTAKVTADTQEWHKKATKIRESMSAGSLVTLAESAIQSNVYNKDFGHQAAGIVSWYRETGDITRQQQTALSYFVFPYVQMGDILADQASQQGPQVSDTLVAIESAIRDVQSGLTGRVQVTDRTSVYATASGVRVDIQRPVAASAQF